MGELRDPLFAGWKLKAQDLALGWAFCVFRAWGVGVLKEVQDE